MHSIGRTHEVVSKDTGYVSTGMNTILEESKGTYWNEYVYLGCSVFIDTTASHEEEYT